MWRSTLPLRCVALQVGEYRCTRNIRFSAGEGFVQPSAAPGRRMQRKLLSRSTVAGRLEQVADALGIHGPSGLLQRQPLLMT